MPSTWVPSLDGDVNTVAGLIQQCDGTTPGDIIRPCGEDAVVIVTAGEVTP